jgi:tRNA A37 threonylcarbamoyladenosine modification protein TsaB
VWPGIVLTASDAKQGRFFAAVYRGNVRLSDYLDAKSITLAEQIAKNRRFPEEPVLLTGSGAEALKSQLLAFFLAGQDHIKADPAARRGRARELLEIAKGAKININDYNSGPFYLRKSDAELKLVVGASNF